MTEPCLMESMSRIQEWWSPSSMRKRTMQHGDPHYGGLGGKGMVRGIGGVGLGYGPPVSSLTR